MALWLLVASACFSADLNPHHLERGEMAEIGPAEYVEPMLAIQNLWPDGAVEI